MTRTMPGIPTDEEWPATAAKLNALVPVLTTVLEILTRKNPKNSGGGKKTGRPTG